MFTDLIRSGREDAPQGNRRDFMEAAAALGISVMAGPVLAQSAQRPHHDDGSGEAGGHRDRAA